jgi:hypothetical protein
LVNLIKLTSRKNKIDLITILFFSSGCGFHQSKVSILQSIEMLYMGITRPAYRVFFMFYGYLNEAGKQITIIKNLIQLNPI